MKATISVPNKDKALQLVNILNNKTGILGTGKLQLELKQKISYTFSNYFVF
jgi:hypothetical protein